MYRHTTVPSKTRTVRPYVALLCVVLAAVGGGYVFVIGLMQIALMWGLTAA